MMIVAAIRTGMIMAIRGIVIGKTKRIMVGIQMTTIQEGNQQQPYREAYKSCEHPRFSTAPVLIETHCNKSVVPCARQTHQSPMAAALPKALPVTAQKGLDLPSNPSSQTHWSCSCLVRHKAGSTFIDAIVR
jgi:hypothetical protein